MHVAVYLPLLVAALLGALSPVLARRLPPRTATRLLTAAAVPVASATSFVLAVLAFTFLAQLAPVSAWAPWSVPALAAADPVPRLAALLAAVAVAVLAAAVARLTLVRARSLLAARTLCHRLGGDAGQLVVVDDDVDVFALPTAGGRIIASRAVLAALPADERRAMLAHEAAHLRHRHHVYRLAADLAAALNPLLRPLARGVQYATERWADEEAAAVVADRRLVARTVARAGLHRAGSTPPPWVGVALPVASSSVVGRVRALLEPAPRAQPLAVLVVVGLLAVTAGATLEAQHDTERLFERSMAAAITDSTPLTPDTHQYQPEQHRARRGGGPVAVSSPAP